MRLNVAAACAAIVRRVAALCGRFSMVDSDGIKNAARLVCLRLRRYSFYILYYIIIFFFSFCAFLVFLLYAKEKTAYRSARRPC